LVRSYHFCWYWFLGSPFQGSSIGLNGNGTILASGGLQDNAGNGAVWIWVLNSATGQWSTSTKLVPSDGSGSFFGSSVDLSLDGTTLVVGGNSDNNENGAIWVFKWNGNSFQQLGTKLVGVNNLGGATLGTSVSASGNGQVIASGGPQDGSFGIGAVWVWTFNGTSYTNNIKLLGTGLSSTPNLGQSVSLSSDGSYLVAGAPADCKFSGCTGAVVVWKQINGQWTQQQGTEPNNQIGPTLVGTGSGANGGEGYSVAIDPSGTYIVEGSATANGGNGYAWIFTH